MRNPFRPTRTAEVVSVDNHVRGINRSANDPTSAAARQGPAPMDYTTQVIAASDVLLHGRDPSESQTLTAVRNLIAIADQAPEQRYIAQSGLQAHLRSPAAVGPYPIDPEPLPGPRLRTLTPAAELAPDHLNADPRLLRPNLPGVDWSNVDLGGRSLRGADLSAANLDRASITPRTPGESTADLTRVRLVGASLQCTRLDGAQLYEADLTGADLNGAALAGATLDRVTASRADFTAADLSNAYAVAAQLRGADLSRANLKDATLVLADLHRAHLNDANLHPADLTGSALNADQVLGAELAGAQLADTGLDQGLSWVTARDTVALDGADEIPDVLDWVTGQHRTTQRKAPPAPDEEEQRLRAWLRSFATTRPRWGWRRAAKTLRREGWLVNDKRVQRLWPDEGLKVPYRKRKKPHRGIGAMVGAMGPAAPNALWAMDVQFDTTADGRTLRLFNVIDEFTREALVIEVDRSIDADKVVAVLDSLAAARRPPGFVRFDNGRSSSPVPSPTGAASTPSHRSSSTRAHRGRTGGSRASTAGCAMSCSTAGSSTLCSRHASSPRTGEWTTTPHDRTAPTAR